jgi:hypothetical protein
MYKRNILIMGIASALFSGCGGEGSTAIIPTAETTTETITEITEITEITTEITETTTEIIEIIEIAEIVETTIETTSDTTFADLTYGQQYKFDAVSQSGSFTMEGDNITSSTLYPQSTTSSHFTYGSDNDGTTNYVQIQDTDTGVDFSFADAANFIELGEGVRVLYAGNETGTKSMVFIDLSFLDFEYQTFGIWDQETSANAGHLGLLSIGVTTPESSIPTSGTATYNGAALGYKSSTNGEMSVIASELDAIADFSNRSLSLQTFNTTIMSLYGELDSIDDNISGTLSYASGSGTFSGNVSTDSGYTGLATGKFYGPNANEIGGVMSVKGSNDLAVIAMGFGATQQ